MDHEKAIRAAKLTLGGILEKRRAKTAVERAEGQIAPSKYLPNVPRQVHANGGPTMTEEQIISAMPVSLDGADRINAKLNDIAKAGMLGSNLAKLTGIPFAGKLGRLAAEAIATSKDGYANGGYVPMASLPIPKLAVAGALPMQRQPGLLDALGSLASIGKSATGIADLVLPEKEEAPRPHADRVEARAEGLTPEATAAMEALRKGWTGQDFGIVSGYRSPEENRAAKGAKDSQHTHGNAYDVNTTGWSPEEKLALADAAWDAGFRGFGFYDNNMHFDVGGERAWGPSYSRDSIPDWAQGWASQRYGYAEGGEVTDLGQAREQKQLQTFHTGMMDDIHTRMTHAMEAHQKAVDAGVFDGYEVGDTLQGSAHPMRITGRYMQAWKPSTTTLAHFDRMNTKPTIIEHEGKQYIPMLRYQTGKEGVDGFQEGTAYLDGVRAAGYQKMGGLRAVKADGGSVSAKENFLAGNHPDVPDELYHGNAPKIVEKQNYQGDGKWTSEVDQEATDRNIAAQDFRAFKPSQYGNYGPGIYLSDSPKTASSYAQGIRADQPEVRPYGQVMKLHVSMKQPFTDDVLRHPAWVDYIKNVFNKYNLPQNEREQARAVMKKLDDGTATMRDVFLSDTPHGTMVNQWGHHELHDTIRNSGFDGIIADRGDGTKEYVAFKPEQVKSAISATKFDPTDPDITKAEGGRIQRADGGRLNLYSKAARIVSGMKDQPMQAADIVKYALGKGAKKTELAHVDVPPGKATPKQVADHIEFMQPQIGVQRREMFYRYSDPEKYERQINYLDRQGRHDEAEELNREYEAFSGFGGSDAPKYARYQLPGGENYREHVLTLDDHPDDQTYTSPIHWGKTKNPLVHVRMSDRMDGNKKILHIEELQSDWNNDARRMGFRSGKEQAEYDAFVAQMRQKAIDKIKARTGQTIFDQFTGEERPYQSSAVEQAQIEKYQRMDPYMLALKVGQQSEHHQLALKAMGNSGVPQAPYINPDRDDASEVGLKHILMEAAKGGYDGIAFTPDEAQEERWPGHKFKGIYNKKLPGMAERLVRQHDPDYGLDDMMNISGWGAPVIPLSEEARDSINKNGFSSFKRGGVVHRADGGEVSVPQKTVKAYKLFRTKGDGKLYPLFVNAEKPVPMGEWLEAEEGPQGKAQGRVKSKIGDLAYRPGWHAGDLPIATHIGGKSDPSLKKPDYRPDNHVWAEVEMAADKDWQSVADSRGKGVKAHITDQVPFGGFYRYKTNPNMTGNWLIGGNMKVNRVLPDEEVKAINDAAGTADLPRLPRGAFAAGGAAMFEGIHEDLQDEQGNPLDLWHGTPGEGFSEFKDEKLGSTRDHGFYGRGHYLTPDAEGASEYAGSHADEGTLMGPLHAALKNPYIWDASDQGAHRTLRDLQSMGIMKDQGKLEAWDNLQRHHIDPFMAEMQKRGHDGVVVRTNDYSGEKPHRVSEVVVFKPTAIKHKDAAVFDPKDPNIYRANGGAIK